MTQDMMTLRALLEKSSDADLLREMIGFTAERLSRTRFPWTQNWLNRSVQGGPEHDRQF